VPYTRIGTALFDWAPWIGMTPLARSLWLGLYASPQARLFLPGLFRGGPAVMAESACLGVTDAQAALSELCERGLVVRDDRRRLILFTQLPDRGQRPANGKHVHSLFNKWDDLPGCDVTSSYVWLLHWLVQPFTGDHEQAWDRTFGLRTDVMSSTKPISGIVRFNTKGKSRLVRSNTKVHSEPSDDECKENDTQTSMFPQESDTHPDTHGDTHVCTVICSGESSRSEQGGAGGRTRGPANGKGKKTRPWAIKDLLAALRDKCAGRVATEPWDVRMAKPLWAVVDACVAADVTLDDVRLAGEWLAAGGLGYRDDLGIPWIAKTGELLNAVAKARVWAEAGRGSVESRKQGPKRVTAADLAARAAALEARGE
jgi:hypothetical protein